MSNRRTIALGAGLDTHAYGSGLAASALSAGLDTHAYGAGVAASAYGAGLGAFAFDGGEGDGAGPNGRILTVSGDNLFSVTGTYILGVAG